MAWPPPAFPSIAVPLCMSGIEESPTHCAAGDHVASTLISALVVFCRSVLNEKFKGYDGMNIYMLYGSIIHAFFQQVHTRLVLKTLSKMGWREVELQILRPKGGGGLYPSCCLDASHR